MIECELKIERFDFYELLDTMKAKSLKFETDERQVNYLYKINDIADSYIRIRNVFDNLLGSNHSLITLKTMIERKGNVLIRKEIETKIEDYEKLMEIFKSLGYTMYKVVEKNRLAFNFNECIISVDTILDPDGDISYIEIEGHKKEQLYVTASLLNLKVDRLYV